MLENKGLLFKSQTWKSSGCEFHFPGPNDEKDALTCPPMSSPVCYVYNGAVCCASRCPGISSVIALFFSQRRPRVRCYISRPGLTVLLDSTLKLLLNLFKFYHNSFNPRSLCWFVCFLSYSSMKVLVGKFNCEILKCFYVLRFNRCSPDVISHIEHFSKRKPQFDSTFSNLVLCFSKCI